MSPGPRRGDAPRHAHPPPAPDDAPGGGEAAASRPTRLLVAALVIGLWAVVPPYSGPELNTEFRKEVADHVVPSILLLVLLLAAVLGAARSSLAMLVLGLTVLLAGLWMTATHVPLVAQALRGEVSWAPTLWHTIPGLAVLSLGGVWAGRYYVEVDEDEPRE